MKNLNRILSISLAMAILAAMGCLVYVIAAPKQGEKFTEFYILNTEGEASNYPDQVVLGEPVELIVGIINHEQEPTGYRVEIKMDGAPNEEITVATLADEEKWEEVVSFTPQTPGERQKLEFWLYKYEEANPYFEDPLHLYIDVNQFYILNAEGRAEDYPSQVVLGEPVELILGIISHEYELTSYWVKIRVEGILYEVIETEPLSHWEKWEEAISFTPRLPGKRQEVEFWLYKVGEFEPYYEVPIHFYIDVTKAG
jgi:uncharacterized membrane protein